MKIFTTTNKQQFQEETRCYFQFLESYFEKLSKADERYPSALQNQEYVDYVTYHKWPIRQLEYSYVIQKIQDYIQPGFCLLDAGCGVSPIPFLWKDSGAEVTAVDLSKESIELMTALDHDSYFGSTGTPAKFVQANLVKLPFADSSFDVIESISVLEHLAYPDYLAALSDLYRVLKPNGLLVCTCDLNAGSAKKMGSNGAFSAEDIRRFLSCFKDELTADCADYSTFSISQEEIDHFWESHWYDGIGYQESRKYTAVGFAIQKRRNSQKTKYLLKEHQLSSELRDISTSFHQMEQALEEKEAQIQLLSSVAQERLQLIKKMNLESYSYKDFEHDIRVWRPPTDITPENFTWYKDDMYLYQSMENAHQFELDINYLYPVVSDKAADAGYLSCNFWQDIWAARHVAEKKPQQHYDIGSRIDGFIGYMSVLKQNTTLIDIRPLNKQIPHISFIQADATNLDGIEDDSIESLSALCSLEHFGLGRYGDAIDPEACFRAFESIQRKIKSGGSLYLSVPIGYEHLEFNAHRVFFASTIIDAFHNMKLMEFSVASEQDGLEYKVEINKYDSYRDKGAGKFGLFYFLKDSDFPDFP